jgi:hypothetical protein
MRDLVATDSVANGFGKSPGVIFRNRPGFTVVDETKAAGPVRISWGRVWARVNVIAPNPVSEQTKAIPGH